MMNTFSIAFGSGPHQFGGHPSLPAGTTWPAGQGGPLVHLMTVQLGEQLTSPLLPTSGQLVIFVDPSCAGYDPKDVGACRVIHLKTGATVQPCQGPKALTKQEFSLTPTQVEPAQGSIFPITPGKSPREEEPLNHLLGFPYPEQRNTMELQCQLTSNGFYTGNASGYNDPRAQIVKAGADNWRLLLQLQSIPELPLMFGDQGVLYLYCPLDEMGKMELSKCWQLIQS